MIHKTNGPKMIILGKMYSMTECLFVKIVLTTFTAYANEIEPGH